MNKVLVIALIAGLAVSAQAAPQKPVRVAALESVDQSTTKIQSETTKMENVVPSVSAKKWSGVLETENYKAVNTNNYKGDIVADEKAEVKYKINDTNSVSVAQEWSRSYDRGARGKEEYSHDTLQDTSVRYTRSGYKLPSNVGYAVQGRVYLPVSTDSQNKGQLTQLRVYNMFSKPLSKNLEAALIVNPRLFIQDNAGSDEVGANRFRLLNSVGLKYSITEKVAIEQTVGYYMKWKNSGTNAKGDYVAARADNLDASTSVYISAASWLDLNIGIRQSDDAANTRVSGAQFYKPEQSEYFAIATFSM